METGILYNENCLDTMRNRIPDESIDLTVTSPPYDDMRTYNGFSFPFEDIAKELFRITKMGGVIVWIVNDETADGTESGTSFRQALFFKEIGFMLHDTMIWLKQSAAYPASDSSNRYSQVFEYMFVLSKGKPKTTNLLKDRKNKWAGVPTFGSRSERKRTGEISKRDKSVTQDYSYRYNVWECAVGHGFGSTDEIVIHHPAIFPERLAHDHILTWSNKDDIVYDPFAGSGTTPKMAHLTGRRWIASEISEVNCKISTARLSKYVDGISVPEMPKIETKQSEADKDQLELF